MPCRPLRARPSLSLSLSLCPLLSHPIHRQEIRWREFSDRLFRNFGPGTLFFSAACGWSANSADRAKRLGAGKGDPKQQRGRRFGQRIMPVYNFKALPTVPTASDLLDVVLSKTQRSTPTVVRGKWQISRIRQFYMVRTCPPGLSPFPAFTLPSFRTVRRPPASPSPSCATRPNSLSLFSVLSSFPFSREKSSTPSRLFTTSSATSWTPSRSLTISTPSTAT